MVRSYFTAIYALWGKTMEVTAGVLPTTRYASSALQVVKIVSALVLAARFTV